PVEVHVAATSMAHGVSHPIPQLLHLVHCVAGCGDEFGVGPIFGLVAQAGGRANLRLVLVLLCAPSFVASNLFAPIAAANNPRPSRRLLPRLNQCVDLAHFRLSHFGHLCMAIAIIMATLQLWSPRSFASRWYCFSFSLSGHIAQPHRLAALVEADVAIPSRAIL